NTGRKKTPAEEMPRQNSSNLQFLCLQSSMISKENNAATPQMSLSGLHKIKEMKNEISELKLKVEASSLENQILKQLQCRHLKAINSYKNSKSNFMDLSARHDDDVRVLRNLLKISNKNERKTSAKLRKVEAELLKAKDALQTLHTISEDKELAERDELYHRLSVLTEKIEVNNRRIQSLEKQLKLNNSTFIHQLAKENKKAEQAGAITKNLQNEIISLHQKIKEKDRQLYIKNIYANRIPTIPICESDSAPYENNFSTNRSVQTDKQSFQSLLQSQCHIREREKSPVQLIKKMSSEYKNQKATAGEVCTDAQCRAEEPLSKKTPRPETLNETYREYLMEDRLLMEVYASLEFMKEEETDLLKQKLKSLMKTEETPLSYNVQEEDAVEEYEREEKKPEQLQNSEKAGSERGAPSPRNKRPIRLKKNPVFSEITENFLQGLLQFGIKSKQDSLHKHRRMGQSCSETAEPKAKNSFGLYEPSFGKVARRRQENSPTEAEHCANMTLAEIGKSVWKNI
ncbi:LCA5L protein, partial [Rhinopomastus cyanomelas]|nr:LCA5L protein [Rhinopomastus cyanomelas]